MKKDTIILGVVIAICVLGIFYYVSFSKSQFVNPFKAKSITIDKTANIIEEINQLAEFTTTTYYQEIVIHEVKENFLLSDDELILIAKGTVRAGFDVSSLSSEDINIDLKTHSITVKLPEVKILDIITNPSDFETYVESGEWSFEEVNEFKKGTREKFEKEAVDGGILELAEKTAVEKLTALFQAFGFVNVVVER